MADSGSVLGTLQENPWAKPNRLTESSELSRIGPGFVSVGESDILRRKVYTRLDPTLPSGIDVAPPGKFDLHAPVILMKGSGPFVISSDSQREVGSKLQWKSMLYIWGGAAAALWGLWEILEKAKAGGWLLRDF